jgi:uncharacterized membrane protein (DUF4010 family)
MTPLEHSIGLAIATLGGAVVGLERQRSGHADGPAARFGGLRTFALLGLVGGVIGVLAGAGHEGPASALALGATAFVVAAYVAASRVDVDGTTEVAALVVVAAGILAGLGRVALASGVAILTGLVLVEKSRLHAFAAWLDATDLRAGIRFGAMALIVLPVLPIGPFGPAPGIRPRELWALVLFFSALSFAGHVAQRAVGARHAYWIAGAIGGLISSTNVTLTYARTSRADPAAARALALGALAANAMLFPRVLGATAVMNAPLALELVPWLLPAAAIVVGATAVGIRRAAPSVAATPHAGNPLRVGAALQMALLFQTVLFAVDTASRWFGAAGVYGSAAALGVTDVDALTLTMSRNVAPSLGLEVAARAIVVGVLSNTVLKALVSAVVGRASYRLVCAGPLTVLALLLALMLWRS